MLFNMEIYTVKEPDDSGRIVRLFALVVRCLVVVVGSGGGWWRWWW